MCFEFNTRRNLGIRGSPMRQSDGICKAVRGPSELWRLGDHLLRQLGTDWPSTSPSGIEPAELGKREPFRREPGQNKTSDLGKLKITQRGNWGL